MTARIFKSSCKAEYVLVIYNSLNLKIRLSDIWSTPPMRGGGLSFAFFFILAFLRVQKRKAVV